MLRYNRFLSIFGFVSIFFLLGCSVDNDQSIDFNKPVFYISGQVDNQNYTINAGDNQYVMHSYVDSIPSVSGIGVGQVFHSSFIKDIDCISTCPPGISLDFYALGYANYEVDHINELFSPGHINDLQFGDLLFENESTDEVVVSIVTDHKDTILIEDSYLYNSVLSNYYLNFSRQGIYNITLSSSDGLGIIDKSCIDFIPFYIKKMDDYNIKIYFNESLISGSESFVWSDGYQSLDRTIDIRDIKSLSLQYTDENSCVSLFSFKFLSNIIIVDFVDSLFVDITVNTNMEKLSELMVDIRYINQDGELYSYRGMDSHISMDITSISDYKYEYLGNSTKRLFIEFDALLQNIDGKHIELKNIVGAIAISY